MQSKIEEFTFLADGKSLQSNSAFSSNSERLSFIKKDDSDFSIKMLGLPVKLARVFVKGDIVTFVNMDGQIQMKSLGCLQQSEQQMLQQFKIEIQQVEEKYKRNMKNNKQSVEKSDLDTEKLDEEIRESFNKMFGKCPIRVPVSIHPSSQISINFRLCSKFQRWWISF